MARVERGNVVLHVPDDEIQHYLTLGYNVTDENGNILQEALPNNLAFLQKAYIENKKRIADLQAAVQRLQAELAEADNKKADVQVEEPAVKKGRKKSPAI